MFLLNKSKFDSVLSMSKNNQAALLKMLHNLLSAAEGTIEQLQTYAQQQQREQLMQALHKLRGGYATLGAEQLAERCRALEHALEHQTGFDEASLTEVITSLRQTCDAIRSALPQPEQPVKVPEKTIDLQQLYTMLKQQNMQAFTLVTAQHDALARCLPEAIAQQLSERVSELNFSAAADLLAPFVLHTESPGQ